MEDESPAPDARTRGNGKRWMRKALIGLLIANALVLLGVSANAGEEAFPIAFFLVLLSGSAAVPFVTETGPVALGFARAFVLLYGGMVALVGGVVGACAGMSFGASGGGDSMPLLALAGMGLGILMALLAVLAPSRRDDPETDGDEGGI